MTQDISNSDSGGRLVVPQSMRSIVYDKYGDPSRLHLAEVETPRRMPGSIVIQVHAAGVNPIDARLRSGEAKWLIPGGFPRIPGYDVAGKVVDAAGDTGPQIGDRVLAFLDSTYGGGYAEYVRCAVSAATTIPDQMSFEEAAAIPLAGSTALQSLRDKGEIGQGKFVLINGASGGVGGFAVQIAKSYQAEVTGVASGAHRDFVLEMGADSFIDYEQEDFWASNRKWDLIFDVAGTCNYADARKVLKSDGYFVTTEPNFKTIALTLLSKVTSRHASMMIARPNKDDLAELVRLYEAGQMRVTLADVLPLDRAAEAHQRLKSGGHRGKYVLRVVDDS